MRMHTRAKLSFLKVVKDRPSEFFRVSFSSTFFLLVFVHPRGWFRFTVERFLEEITVDESNNDGC